MLTRVVAAVVESYTLFEAVRPDTVSSFAVISASVEG